jgi:hypothetical protein
MNPPHRATPSAKQLARSGLPPRANHVVDVDDRYPRSSAVAETAVTVAGNQARGTAVGRVGFAFLQPAAVVRLYDAA